MSKRDVVVHKDDDVVVMEKDGKSCRVAILQAGVFLSAELWDTKKWERYMSRRIAATRKGQPLPLGLTEKEK